MKRIDEIQARVAEIRAEVEKNPDMSAEELQQRNSELDMLNAERTQIEARQRLIDNLPSVGQSAPEQRNELEERAENLRKTGQMRLSLTGEKRAITLGSTTGLIKPTNNATQINGIPFAQVSSIIDMVKAIDLAGMSEYQVPYQTATGTAAKNAENTAPTGNADPTFKYATIKPVTLTTYTEISRECMKLTNVDYYSRVLDSARVALRKKVADYIINSDAASSATFIGVLNAPALETDDDLTINAIDATTLRKIAMNYGGDEEIAGNAVLFLNKKDLIAFGDVRGTNEKKAVYEITPDASNPNTGIIRDGGLAVRYCINSNLKANSAITSAPGGYYMIYGVPTTYELGIFSDYNVRVSEDYAFKTRMIAVLGEVMIGGNVTVHRGFLRVKKTVNGG